MSHNQKTKAQQFLKFLVEIATGSLRADFLKKEDRENLQYGLNRVESAFTQMATHYIEPFSKSQSSVADHGYGLLWELMAAAFLIGAHGTVTQSVVTYIATRNGKLRGTQSITWHSYAKNLAVECNNRASKAAVARYIRGRWPQNGGQLPTDDRQLIRFITGLIQRGDITLTGH